MRGYEILLAKKEVHSVRKPLEDISRCVDMGPCEACEHRAHCARNEAACEAAYRYAQGRGQNWTNAARVPTAEWYARLYRKGRLYRESSPTP